MNDSLLWLNENLKRKYRIAILTILQSFLSLFTILYAVLLKYLLDYATESSTDKVIRVFILLIVSFLIQSILSALTKRIQETTKIDFENDLKKVILNNILRRDYSLITSIHSGELMTKITNDVNVISGNVTRILPNLAGMLCNFAAGFILLIHLEPKFVLFFLIFLFAIFGFEAVFYRFIKKYHKEVMEKEGSLRSFIKECISSIIVIKTFNKEDFFLSETDSYLNEYKKADMKKNRFSVFMNLIFSLSMDLVVAFSGVYCALQIVNGNMSYGTLLAVIQIVTQMRTPIANAYSSFTSYYSIIGSVERIREIENYPLENSCNENDVMSFYRDIFHGIEFENVCFSYQTENQKDGVFNDFSLLIDKGDFIVINGPSGCGKSTLFKLLLALYKIKQGKILICSENEKIDLDESWRKLFSYVPQNNMLMRGTIRDVICFGKEYDETAMNSALKISCCDEFLSRTDNCLDTVLNESGSGLSEGQLQRIAIARAVYSDRPIILLDEATSALNEELELKVLMNLKGLSDKTVVLITHRKKASEFADKVIECRETDGEYIWE